MDGGDSAEHDRSIRLPISELNKLSQMAGSSTIVEPQGRVEKNANSVSPTRAPAVCTPEKKLTLFALQLAVLEKAATGLGTLGFIWATVVLLGGFAVTLSKTDFWFITIILLIEGTRIFSRSHELKWQHHQAAWSIADAGINRFRQLKSSSHSVIGTFKSVFRPLHETPRQCQHSGDITESTHVAKPRNWNRRKMPAWTRSGSDVHLLQYGQKISKLLYWLQLLSATACAVLSSTRLVKHNYGSVEKEDTEGRNRQSALHVFYALALAEALLFLLERAYGDWKVIYCKLFEQVNEECELGDLGIVSIRRFVYDAYSRCLNGSIFDGLEMDMASFAMDLLASNSLDEQLIGARILRQFSMKEQFSDYTLKKIGVTLSVIERLVDMLNWKDPREEEIRQSAAEILSKLAGKKQNSLRVAGIPGAMESISSLLHAKNSSSGAADVISVNFGQENYGFCTFNNLGLLILKKLARDHDNCGKIGNTRGLLSKIIEFTHAGERWLKDENATASQIMKVKRSLQLVKMLASMTCTTGKHLRRGISEIVFIISNIRDILRYGEKHPLLQQLSIEILTNLALEEDATEKIGGTGGVIKELFNIFFKQGMPENYNHLKSASGEAIGMLALESKSNCYRILKLEVMEKLVGALEVPLLRVHAARILRNLCTYAGTECFHQLKGVTAAAPTVLKAILSEEEKLQEEMVGLAAHVLQFITSQASRILFERAEIKEAELAYALVQILKKYQYPQIETPRIRRFAIDLAILMMRDKEANVHVFKDLGMEKELEGVAESTTELENFNISSGTDGVSLPSTTIHSLVETALKLLNIQNQYFTWTRRSL